MSRQTWVECLVASKVQGPSLSNSTTATSVIPPGDKITLPCNYLTVGRQLRIRGMARVSNIVTTPGTLTLDVRLGAVVAFNGGAMQLSTTAHTTLPLVFQIDLIVRAEGSGTSGNLMGVMVATGQMLSISTSDPTSGHSTLVAPNATPAVGTGYDSTSALTVDLFATFSVANAGNLFALEQFYIEALN